MRKTLGSAAAAAALALPMGLAGTSPAVAADALPTCATIDSLNCQGTFVNTYAGGIFHQSVNGGEPRGETFWPFRNPTVDAASAYTNPDAFPADYVTGKQLLATCTADRAALAGAFAAKDQKIQHLRAQVRRLRARLAHRH